MDRRFFVSGDEQTTNTPRTNYEHGTNNGEWTQPFDRLEYAIIRYAIISDRSDAKDSGHSI